MGAPMRLAAFAVALVGTFALSFGVGRAMEEDRVGGQPTPVGDHDMGGSGSHDDDGDS